MMYLASAAFVVYFALPLLQRLAPPRLSAGGPATALW